MRFKKDEEPLQAGEMLTQETSQPEPIRIPGALAPVVTGRGLFHSLMRSLFRSGCRLGTFARSFAAQRVHDPIGHTAEASLFPMPLPYPEVFKKRTASGDECVALKKFVVMAVIVLNYLHLHRPRTITAMLRPQQKLSKRQWEGVRVLEGYARAWIEVSPIGPEEMGRTAAKVESLEEAISQLESLAASITDQSSYFREPDREDQEGDPKRIQGRVSSCAVQSGMTTFKEIDSKRLSFVGRPSFDPTPYLDATSQRIFQDPLSTREPIGPSTRKPPRLRVHCPKSEKIRLFELLDSTDRLAIHRADEVTPLYGSGLFAVTKSLTKDRMILDSRGANVLESPPNRWIKSLASAEVICRYQLLPHEELVTSGNDLKDFYYFFKSTSSRSRRNVLVGAMHPKELSHLRALKPEHLQEECVFGALKTLAMGDCQAVELAQSCHLGLAVSAEVVNQENLVSLMKPPPRTATTVGLVIDDFVTLSRRPRGAEGQSEGAQKADRMLDSYEAVGLMPNREKSFRDDMKSSFWGADVDGSLGHVRGSLKRALPLTSLIIKLVNVGYGTVDLLQTVAGCIISLFLYRRRFLAILDSLFESYRGRRRRDVVQLSGRVKSDLLTVAVLLPLAVANLRSRPPDRIYASDASSWGEAAVHASIPTTIGAELLRHTLRRSIWVRLLAPAAAWERSHGALTEDEEVPENEEPYQSNPLWETLARSLNYRLTFAKAKQAPRHINVGEIRGALKAEKLGAMRRPSSRLLLGLDSQVGLGALIKGRSASPALNAELSRSLPHMVLLDYNADYFYYHTKFNPADDPTRGREVRTAEVEVPSWWAEVEQGQYGSFDEWLRIFGLDDYSVSGLPEFEELHGSEKGCFTAGILPRNESSDTGSSTSDRMDGIASTPKSGVEEMSTEAEKSTEAESNKSQEEECSPTSSWVREELDGLAAEECAGGPGAEEEEATEDRSMLEEDFKMLPERPRKVPCDEGIFKKQQKGCTRRVLSEEAREILRSFPKDQFVLPKGCAWPPREAGFLDLFSGERGVAKEAARLGVWSLCFDLEHSPNEDLSDRDLQKRIESGIRAGCFSSLGGGPVCASFSTAITPPVRSSKWPYGRPDVSANMAEKLKIGNASALWMFGVLRLGLELGYEVWLENPSSSWMFRLPEWLQLMKDFPHLQFWTVDYCRFGMEWRKRTKFATTSQLGGKKDLCSRDHQHRLLRGRCRQAKMSWTRVAQPYPRGVARCLAFCHCMATGAVRYQQFNPGECAKAGGLRIGEAAHPGPRRPNYHPRTELLGDVPLVEARTRVLQSKVWLGFSEWLVNRLSPAAMESALSQPSLLVLMLQEYGNCLYEEGRALYLYRHLVVLVQQSFLLAKPFMGPAWNMIAKWERLEPSAHRAPVPEALYRAVVSVSLCWGWRYFAAVVGVSFLGITRPSEALFALRKNLVLPNDRLEPESKTVYLRIVKAKTSGRGNARIQHASFDSEVFVRFLESIYRDHPSEVRLNPLSSSAFRRRWDAILASLEIPVSCGLTPGGLRGGGCVTAFQAGCDINRLLWRMRLRHQITLENYLQEVSASVLVSSLPSRARRRIHGAASLYEVMLQKFTSS